MTILLSFLVLRFPFANIATNPALVLRKTHAMKRGIRCDRSNSSAAGSRGRETRKRLPTSKRPMDDRVRSAVEQIRAAARSIERDVGGGSEDRSRTPMRTEESKRAKRLAPRSAERERRWTKPHSSISGQQSSAKESQWMKHNDDRGTNSYSKGPRVRSDDGWRLDCVIQL